MAVVVATAFGHLVSRCVRHRLLRVFGPLAVTRYLHSEALRVALLLALIAVSISGSGLLVRIDHLIFDVGQRLNRRAAPGDVLIIAIDEDSLDRLGRWPWPRDQHARLLQALCASKPAAIAVDIAFSEPSSDPLADALLAKALADCGNVVLPLVIEATRVGGQLLESPPISRLAAVAAGMGRTAVRLDEDGIARAVDLREGVGAATWPLLAEEVLRIARQLPAQANAIAAPVTPLVAKHELLRDQSRRIEFVGPPGTVPRLSYVNLLEGQIAPAVFADKIVLVGATAIGLGDFLPTPLSALGQPMPGVEVLANVLISMRDGRLISILPMAPTLLLAALLAGVPMLWLRRLMPLPGLLASSAWVLVLGAACALLPSVAQLWFAPAGALFAALFAFPLWSWRRLEAARRHLDQELRQLRAILPESQATQAFPAEIRRLDFEQRIAWVQAAQRSMQALEAQRNEALAFISHDLRTPLASAVSQLESPDGCAPENLLPSLRRALGMAQAFLWLARAEALERRQMKELELTAVLEQAADELYALARQRQVSLVRQLPEAPVWITGDFQSLERCAINLLHNALTYAPAGTQVSIGIDLPVAGEVIFWVANAGPPLSGEQLDRLFQRFSRGDQVAVNPSSTGLGLYFVRTVAERHGGEAGVTCVAGTVRFWVRLAAAVVAANDSLP